MSNLGNIQKLNYCQQKFGNRCTCANIATYQVSLSKRGIPDNEQILSQQYQYRCEHHKSTGTISKKVTGCSPYDQGYALTKINTFLMGLIGKRIKSRMHTARELEVKFLKPNTGGVMCFQPLSKKWKFVYYNQIEQIF